MRKIFALAFMVLLPCYTFAQNTGELTLDRFFYGKGDSYNLKTIESLTVKWSFSTLYGEPVINGAFQWEAGSDCPSDYLGYQDFIVLQTNRSVSSKGVCIKLSPTVPESGDGFGMNTPGSPSWEDVFCNYEGESLDLTTEEAKEIWKTGFKIIDAHLEHEE